MIDEILETSIPLPAPFDITLMEVFGGEIEGKVTCVEERINQIVTAARDWKIISMKELFNIWLRKIKKFLNAIGLGKLLDFLDLTLCDVMELVGLPLEIEIPLPDLSIMSLRIEPPLLIHQNKAVLEHIVVRYFQTFGHHQQAVLYHAPVLPSTESVIFD